MTTWARRALLVLLATGCRAPSMPPPGASGAELYRAALCSNCHGPDGDGTFRGPTLRRLDAHWTAGALARFLADPEAIAAGDVRLRALQERHGLSRMGVYATLDADQRATLATWLLERSH